jgi:predicted ATPase
MAHITEFAIDNLAGRTGSYAKKLNRDVNVFFGLNGAGKTSLLRILDSAMRRNSAGLETVPFDRAEVKIHSLLYNKIFTHTIDNPQRKKTLTPPIQDSAQLPALSSWSSTSLTTTLFETEVASTVNQNWKVSPSPPGQPKGWEHGWLPTSRLYSGGQPRRAAPVTVEPSSEQILDKMFADALTTLWSRYSARVLGEVRRVQESGLSNILEAVLNAPDKRKTRRRLTAPSAYKRIETFLKRPGAGGHLGPYKDFQKLYNDDLRVVAVANHIDTVETEIESATAPRVRLQELIQHMFTGPKTIEFTDNSINVLSHDRRDIGLASLSSGEKQALRVFTEVLAVGESAVLIDQPEISLHIDWQKNLIKYMQTLNPHAQLLLATHSPEIMADLKDSRIFQM